MLGLVARVGAVLAFTGINVTWSPFRSTIYPYTISQPSSYKHMVLKDPTSGIPVDYFFPSLGSQFTNVDIYCDHARMNPKDALRSLGAKNVHHIARILIDGHRRALIRGEFDGMTGHWTEEQVVYSEHGRVWHLTISYDRRFRSQRGIELRMIRHFKPD
jgi:hypothetical protein